MSNQKDRLQQQGCWIAEPNERDRVENDPNSKDALQKLLEAFPEYRRLYAERMKEVSSSYGPDGDAINYDAAWISQENVELYGFSQAVNKGLEDLKKGDLQEQNVGARSEREMVRSSVKALFDGFEPSRGKGERLERFERVAHVAIQNLQEQLGVPGRPYNLRRENPAQMAQALRSKRAR